MGNYTRVFFDGLGISFNIPSVAFTVGSYEVHWYGIIIAIGFKTLPKEGYIFFGRHCKVRESKATIRVAIEAA